MVTPKNNPHSNQQYPPTATETNHTHYPLRSKRKGFTTVERVTIERRLLSAKIIERNIQINKKCIIIILKNKN